MADSIYDLSNPNATVIKQLESVYLLGAIQRTSRRDHVDNLQSTEQCSGVTQCRRELSFSQDTYVPSKSASQSADFMMQKVMIRTGIYTTVTYTTVESTVTVVPEAAKQYQKCKDGAFAISDRDEARAERQWCFQHFLGTDKEPHTSTELVEVQTGITPAVNFGMIVFDFVLSGSQCELKVNGDQQLIAGGVELTCSENIDGVTDKGLVRSIYGYFGVKN
ncbi:MAG: hypothetical protein ACD_62C00204G0006 [uncultured bacterium]|nr:MAG: hypothetical protein ACD_62C00204G0006 [uncultured bacterium]